MSVTTTPPPIPGRIIDPAPRETPEKVAEADERAGAVGVAFGVGYRAYLRYSHAKVGLLAAGTTYYLFLSLFSVIAFAYGLTAALGAEQIAGYITEAVAEAFPGLLGQDGIDPAQLRAVGQTTSLIGAIGLLYGGTGAVVGAKQSIHLIYGAPKDPRNYVVARLIALLWLIVLGVLILLSFVASSVAGNLYKRALTALDIEWNGPGILLNLAAAVITLAVNFLIVYLLLGHFGGIRPPTAARVIASAVGAVAIEVLKTLMTVLISFTIDKPEYGAFAAPIGVLFVLYLQSYTVYLSGCLAAGVAEREVPLEVLAPADTRQVRAAMEEAAAELEEESEQLEEQADTLEEQAQRLEEQAAEVDEGGGQFHEAAVGLEEAAAGIKQGSDRLDDRATGLKEEADRIDAPEGGTADRSEPKG
jgi:membrane protein